MNQTKTKLALAIASVLGVSSPGAFAQESNADASVFEEIVVTAKRREQTIYEVPAAISAFSAETIEKQGITNLIDIGKFVPNLNVTAFSAGHTSSANAFIRGIGLQDHLITTDPGVSVYVDGVYLGRQVGQNWSLANIERVEVLRGPQGTLYGRNSIGGAINIITRKPGAEETSRIGFEVGTRGRVNADFYTNTQLADDLAVSVSGAFKRRGGLGEFVNVVDPEADVGELRDISARAAVLWTPTDRFSLLVAADGNEGEGGLRPYTTLIDEVPNGAVFGAGFRNSDVAADPYDNNTGQANQTGVSNQAFGISLTATYALSDSVDAQLIVSDRHSEYESGLDDDGFVDDFLSFPETGFADQQSIELQLSGEVGAIDFVTGVYFFEEDGENDQRPTIFLGGPGTFTLGQELESFAVFGNVGYRVSEDLRLSAGIRYTEDEKTATIDINDSLIDTAASRDWDEISWELSASYDLNERMTGYATIANGYQSGQFPPRPFCLFGSLDFTQPGNVSTPNCFVANDNIVATNYEIGIKGQPTDAWQLSVAAFLTDYTDLPYQVSTTSGAGFDTRNIIVDQQSVGLEVESTLLFGDSFQVHTTLGYIDVDVDDPVAVAPLTPELTASISPEYSISTESGGLVSFRADWSYRDDMFGEPTADPGRFTAIDSRDLINFDVSYRSASGRWTAGLYGRNVTDERYDNARLNTGDYVLVILSNDASEFGVRFTTEF
ncbi:MAG: TonB-dependent receptor [Pseudomonadota bacterium]